MILRTNIFIIYRKALRDFNKNTPDHVVEMMRDIGKLLGPKVSEYTEEIIQEKLQSRNNPQNISILSVNDVVEW